MRKLKLVFSVVLALALVFSCSGSAYAMKNLNSIFTINSRMHATASVAPSTALESDVKTLQPYGTDDEVECTSIISTTTVLDESQTNGWYYVEGYVVVDGSISVDGDCGIILADDAVLQFTTGMADSGILVEGDSKLTIYGCSENTGAIVNNESYGSLISVCDNASLFVKSGNLSADACCICAADNSYVELENCCISNSASYCCAVMMQGSSSGKMDEGCVIDASGIGIYVDCQSFTMYDGTISAENEGVDNTAGFVMLGGEISDCAIGLENFGELGLGGNAVIWNNDVNVDLQGGIYMAAQPGAGMQIGLYSEALSAIGDNPDDYVGIMENADESYFDYFACDDSSKALFIEDGMMLMKTRLIEQPSEDNEYAFLIETGDYQVDYTWYSNECIDLLESADTFEDSQYICSYIEDVVYDEGELTVPGNCFNLEDDDDWDAIYNYDAAFTMYIPEGATLRLAGTAHNVETAWLYVIGSGYSGTGDYPENLIEQEFSCDESAVYTIAVAADGEFGEDASFVFSQIELYVPDYSEPLNNNSSFKLDTAGLGRGYYFCKATMMLDDGSEMCLTSTPVYYEGSGFTASVFSSSTGLLAIGGIVIVAAAVIIIVMKKKQVKE